jgi:hypothetical protein
MERVYSQVVDRKNRGMADNDVQKEENLGRRVCGRWIFPWDENNQRSESLNSCLHLHLDFGMTLVDLIMHYENAIVRIRESEVEDDCISSQSLPMAVTQSKEIEVALARAFTLANFSSCSKT